MTTQVAVLAKRAETAKASLPHYAKQKRDQVSPDPNRDFVSLVEVEDVRESNPVAQVKAGANTKAEAGDNGIAAKSTGP